MIQKIYKNKRLNIPYNSFGAKEKQKSFTHKEAEAIVDLLPDDTEDVYWAERARIRKVEPEMATREEVFKILNAQ